MVVNCPSPPPPRDGSPPGTAGAPCESLTDGRRVGANPSSTHGQRQHPMKAAQEVGQLVWGG